MNRVISRATKLSKVIGKPNFFTRLNMSMNFKALQTSSNLINVSKMNFAENDRNTEKRFEKFADSASVINFSFYNQLTLKNFLF